VKGCQEKNEKQKRASCNTFENRPSRYELLVEFLLFSLPFQTFALISTKHIRNIALDRILPSIYCGFQLCCKLFYFGDPKEMLHFS